MKKLATIVLAFIFSAIQTNAQNNSVQKKLNIINFTVYAKDTKIIMEWATDGTVPTYNWEIQRSSDGREFTTIAWVLGPDPSKEGDTYQYKNTIKPTKNQQTFYRLKHTSQNGEEQYSEIISPGTAK